MNKVVVLIIVGSFFIVQLANSNTSMNDENKSAVTHDCFLVAVNTNRLLWAMPANPMDDNQELSIKKCFNFSLSHRPNAKPEEFDATSYAIVSKNNSITMTEIVSSSYDAYEVDDIDVYVNVEYLKHVNDSNLSLDEKVDHSGMPILFVDYQHKLLQIFYSIKDQRFSAYIVTQYNYKKFTSADLSQLFDIGWLHGLVGNNKRAYFSYKANKFQKRLQSILLPSNSNFTPNHSDQVKIFKDNEGLNGIYKSRLINHIHSKRFNTCVDLKNIGADAQLLPCLNNFYGTQLNQSLLNVDELLTEEIIRFSIAGRDGSFNQISSYRYNRLFEKNRYEDSQCTQKKNRTYLNPAQRTLLNSFKEILELTQGQPIIGLINGYIYREILEEEFGILLNWDQLNVKKEITKTDYNRLRSLCEEQADCKQYILDRYSLYDKKADIEHIIQEMDDFDQQAKLDYFIAALGQTSDQIKPAFTLAGIYFLDKWIKTHFNDKIIHSNNKEYLNIKLGDSYELWANSQRQLIDPEDWIYDSIHTYMLSDASFSCPNIVFDSDVSSLSNTEVLIKKDPSDYGYRLVVTRDNGDVYYWYPSEPWYHYVYSNQSISHYVQASQLTPMVESYYAYLYEHASFINQRIDIGDQIRHFTVDHGIGHQVRYHQITNSDMSEMTADRVEHLLQKTPGNRIPIRFCATTAYQQKIGRRLHSVIPHFNRQFYDNTIRIHKVTFQEMDIENNFHDKYRVTIHFPFSSLLGTSFEVSKQVDRKHPMIDFFDDFVEESSEDKESFLEENLLTYQLTSSDTYIDLDSQEPLIVIEPLGQKEMTFLSTLLYNSKTNHYYCQKENRLYNYGVLSYKGIESRDLLLTDRLYISLLLSDCDHKTYAEVDLKSSGLVKMKASNADINWDVALQAFYVSALAYDVDQLISQQPNEQKQHIAIETLGREFDEYRQDVDFKKLILLKESSQIEVVGHAKTDQMLRYFSTPITDAVAVKVNAVGTKKPTIIIGFSGTQANKLGDWVADARLMMNYFISDKNSSRIQNAIHFVERIANEYPNDSIVLVGHSLGGYLASRVFEWIDEDQQLKIAENRITQVINFSAPSSAAIDNQYALSLYQSLPQNKQKITNIYQWLDPLVVMSGYKKDTNMIGLPSALSLDDTVTLLKNLIPLFGADVLTRLLPLWQPEAHELEPLLATASVRQAAELGVTGYYAKIFSLLKESYDLIVKVHGIDNILGVLKQQRNDTNSQLFVNALSPSGADYLYKVPMVLDGFLVKDQINSHIILDVVDQDKQTVSRGSLDTILTELQQEISICDESTNNIDCQYLVSEQVQYADSVIQLALLDILKKDEMSLYVNEKTYNLDMKDSDATVFYRLTGYLQVDTMTVATVSTELGLWKKETRGRTKDARFYLDNQDLFGRFFISNESSDKGHYFSLELFEKQIEKQLIACPYQTRTASNQASVSLMRRLVDFFISTAMARLDINWACYLNNNQGLIEQEVTRIIGYIKGMQPSRIRRVSTLFGWTGETNPSTKEERINKIINQFLVRLNTEPKSEHLDQVIDLIVRLTEQIDDDELDLFSKLVKHDAVTKDQKMRLINRMYVTNQEVMNKFFLEHNFFVELLEDIKGIKNSDNFEVEEAKIFSINLIDFLILNEYEKELSNVIKELIKELSLDLVSLFNTIEHNPEYKTLFSSHIRFVIKKKDKEGHDNPLFEYSDLLYKSFRADIAKSSRMQARRKQEGEDEALTISLKLPVHKLGLEPEPESESESESELAVNKDFSAIDELNIGISLLIELYGYMKSTKVFDTIYFEKISEENRPMFNQLALVHLSSFLQEDDQAWHYAVQFIKRLYDGKIAKPVSELYFQ